MFFRSKPHKAIAMVIIFLAYRKAGVPITLRKMTSMSYMKTKMINKCLVTLKHILPKDTSYDAKPETFITSITQKLHLSQATRMFSLYCL